MKILIVNTHDLIGGAARAAYRLHEGLLSIGIQSEMLVQNKSSDDAHVFMPDGFINKIKKRAKSTLDKTPLRKYKKKAPTLFSTAWVPSGEIISIINASDADIVHLHWIHEGMLRIEDMAKIKKPIVWSLHDMWAFTGGCHYDRECGRYLEGCHLCPCLNSKLDKDLSYRIFNRKKKTYSKIQSLSVIGLSQWMAKLAEKSILFKGRRIVNLPNPIDSSVLRPINKVIAKDILGISKEKKLLLFGAIGISSDPRKGYRELLQAIDLLEKNDIELMIFGTVISDFEISSKYKIHYSGHLNDNLSLRIIYSAANIVIVPSLQENLSNIIMESLTCGTPVVGFDIGGNRDMIEHKQNGYLAKKSNIDDLAKGVRWVIDNNNYNKLCIEARTKVLKNFDNKIIALKYKNLYKEILDDKTESLEKRG